MIVTPSFILSFFEEHGICSYNLIEYNEWKGRYCYKFEYDKKELFLKWNDCDLTHMSHKQSLQREIYAYNLLREKNITPLLYLELKSDGDQHQIIVPSDLLVTEYISGFTTLRTALKEKQYCSDNEEIIRIIKQTLNAWQNCIFTLSTGTLENIPNTFEETPTMLFDRYFGSLLCSGPFETKGSHYELYRNRLLKKVMNAQLKKVLKRYLNNIQKYIIHGDFHANNILINEHACKIIDLENIHLGSPEIELVYIYSQIKLLVRDNRAAIEWMEKYIKQEIEVIENYDLFCFCSSVFFRSIRINHRFY